MTGPGVETAKDFGDKPTGPADRWKAEIRAFDREREGWCKRVEAIEARYRDERKKDDDERRFALLWANVEVLQPTLYARDPKPEVSRRFKDRDPTGRVMALVLERNLDVAIERDEGAFGRTMRAAVRDFLLGAQGTCWIRYGVSMGVAEAEGELPEDEEDVAEPVPVAEDEWASCDYVHWRDFGFTAGARTWDEVTAVWRRSFLTRNALVKRFPKVGDRVPLDAKPPGDGEAAETFAKATVYEVWDSTDRTSRWVHLGMGELLDERPYPLKITGRFPCPCPLFGTLTNGSMVPVPDYVQYQDQARELDELTARIAALTSSLRLAGLVPGDMASDVQRALELTGEAQVVPVASWSALGGAKIADLILWLPIAEVVKVLAELVTLRERVKADAYEITGLSDIIRGSTQANETATAQQIKAQWGSVRVRNRQSDVQRFAAGALGLMAEVMVGHFDAERLAAIANVQALPPQDMQVVPMALEALKGDKTLLHYRVDVETDSTVEADQAADKAAWTELLTGVSSFLGAVAPVLQGLATSAPAAVPAFSAMLGEMLTGAVRRFRAGPQLETAIEAAFEALAQGAAPQQQAPAAPDPVEMAKHQVAQGKLQVDSAKVLAERERTQADMARAQDDSAHRAEDRKLAAATLQLEGAKVQHSIATTQAGLGQGMAQ